ncbi:hypothetical protein N302_04493, partial [Corvus brachyrhynchos]
VNTHPHHPHPPLHLPSPFRPPHNPSPGPPAARLDGGDGGVDVLGDDVAAVQQAARHVLAPARVALDHLVGELEAGVGDLRH